MDKGISREKLEAIKERLEERSDLIMACNARKDIPLLLSEIDRLNALVESHKAAERFMNKLESGGFNRDKINTFTLPDSKPNRLDAIRERAIKKGLTEKSIEANINNMIDQLDDLFDSIIENHRQSKEGE